MKWDKMLSIVVGVCGGIANYLLGGFDVFLRTLLLFMVLDYILGIMCGYKSEKLSSSTAFRGILKKVTILIVVAVGVSIDYVINADGFVRGTVIFFYAGLEGISIAENATRMGVDVPEKLRESLIQLKDGNKKGMK